jgi:hypothetical protein
MAEKGIDPLEIRVNLAAGTLPSPESDISKQYVSD